MAAPQPLAIAGIADFAVVLTNATPNSPASPEARSHAFFNDATVLSTGIEQHRRPLVGAGVELGEPTLILNRPKVTRGCGL